MLQDGEAEGGLRRARSRRRRRPRTARGCAPRARAGRAGARSEVSTSTRPALLPTRRRPSMSCSWVASWPASECTSSRRRASSGASSSQNASVGLRAVRADQAAHEVGGGKADDLGRRRSASAWRIACRRCVFPTPDGPWRKRSAASSPRRPAAPRPTAPALLRRPRRSRSVCSDAERFPAGRITGGGARQPGARPAWPRRAPRHGVLDQSGGSAARPGPGSGVGCLEGEPAPSQCVHRKGAIQMVKLRSPTRSGDVAVWREASSPRVSIASLAPAGVTPSPVIHSCGEDQLSFVLACGATDGSAVPRACGRAPPTRRHADLPRPRWPRGDVSGRARPALECRVRRP